MLFDTDVIIWALRGNRHAADRIDREPILQISAVTYMELIKGARDKTDQQVICKFIHDLNIELLPIDAGVSHRAMIYMEEHALSFGLDMADALIAATAAERNLTLCSANAKHYRVIPNLELEVFKP